MQNLNENPRLIESLAEKGLRIDPSIAKATFLPGTIDKELRIGQIGHKGTLVGFCPQAEDSQRLWAIIYDESKEGEEDALYLLPCDMRREKSNPTSPCPANTSPKKVME